MREMATMTGRIVSKSKNNFTVEVTVSYGDTMLTSEEHLQECLNRIGCLSTQELLERFDSDGSPMRVNDISLTSKGKEEKEYQSPYGPVVANRHVYQSSKGGKTYVPLEIKSKTIGTVTPKFAKMITSKYSDEAAPGVQRDLEENHGRSVSLSFIKKVTDMVGTIAIAKEENWNYELPDFPNKVASIGVGLDGTCLNMKDDGWREAMCGTIAFFDKDGDRMHTIYTGSSPEHGKESFLYRFNNEIVKVKDIYSEVTVVGLADGASSNWKFLEKVCDVLTVDFWHVSEYLATAAKILFPYKRNKEKKENWLDDACHRLKHKKGAASRILKELLKFNEDTKLTADKREKLQVVITYLTNQKKRMSYYKNVTNNYPIGSGVTEAACKTIVKNRMCKGSAKWKDLGASVVLTLRSLHITPFRWKTFWDKYSQYDFTI